MGLVVGPADGLTVGLHQNQKQSQVFVTVGLVVGPVDGLLVGLVVGQSNSMYDLLRDSQWDSI